MPSSPTLRALLFDFDGLVIDTETCHYEAWCEPFTARGVELRLDRWQQVVGTHDSPWSPVTELAELTGEEVDADALRDQVDERYHELLAEQPVMPGVLDLIEEARATGLRVAIASSSRHTWALGHLEPLGLVDRFDAIVGRDLVDWRAKPDPAVYLEALRRLEVPAEEAIALEDSANGVLAAIRAGLRVVAVPNRVTRSMDLSAAATILGDGLAHTSLADLCAATGHVLPQVA